MAQRPYQVSDQQVRTLLNRIENRTNVFRRNLDNALDRSRYDSTRREENINNYVTDFAAATDRLQERFNQRQDVTRDVEEVLSRGQAIDNLMRNNRLTTAQRDWNSLRSDLRTLAGYFNVGWNWDNSGTVNSNYSDNQGRNNFRNRFTGTYSLDVSRSDNADTAIARATTGLAAEEAERMRNGLQRRMGAPERISIDQSNRQFTIVSTTVPKFPFRRTGNLKPKPDRMGELLEQQQP